MLLIAINYYTLRYKSVFKRLFLIVILMSLAVISVKAQFDPSYSHYWAMEPSFNPATVGKDNKLNVIGAYALDFAGYEHNPNTFYVGGDMPVFFMKQYHGVGVSILNDKIGAFTHQRIAGQYAFRKTLWGGVLSAQVGVLFDKFDGSKLDPAEASDPALLTTEANGNSLDLGVGLYYTHKNWYTGVSVQHLNAPLLEIGDKNQFQIDRTYYLTGGYNIKLRNPFVTIKPSVLFKTDGVAWRADVTGRLEYNHDNKLLYCGLNYSPTNSVAMLVGGSFHGVVLGYSYEFYTSGLNPGNGSHELFVGYQHDINFVKKEKNKHKSVRIL